MVIVGTVRIVVKEEVVLAVVLSYKQSVLILMMVEEPLMQRVEPGEIVMSVWEMILTVVTAVTVVSELTDYVQVLHLLKD